MKGQFFELANEDDMFVRECAADFGSDVTDDFLENKKAPRDESVRFSFHLF